MKRLSLVLVLALGAAACAKNKSLPAAKLQGPTGVAVFRGYAAETGAAIRYLVAVSNTRGNDLRVFDALTDKMLLGPTLVYALSVPTEPRPSLIAAGPLADVDSSGAEVALPDLLVVVPGGQVARPGLPGQFAAAVQVIVTWQQATVVDRTIDLGDVAPGATVVSVAVAPVPVPDGAGGWTKAHGAARLLLGMSDDSILVLEAARDASTEAILLGPPQRQDLSFTPLDLAVTPDGTRLYVATTDPIPGAGGILGVADLDLTATPGSFPVRAIGARVGTTSVSYVEVAPFIANDDTATFPDLDLFGPAAPRVFAALDPARCGRDRSMPCGVAALDPVAGGLAPDPAGELPYQMPMQVGGDIVDLQGSGPPAVSSRPGLFQIAPGSGRRWTQSFAAVSSSAGKVYLADLSHFALANDISSLSGSTRAGPGTSETSVPNIQSNPMGFWSRVEPTTPGAPWELLFSFKAVQGIGVTPGYVASDLWNVVYQGQLPGLSTRRGLATVPAASAPTKIAYQEATGLSGPGASEWRDVIRVYDPRMAIQIGDIVEFIATPSGSCPLGKFEMVVTGLVPPSPDAPGGALALEPAASQPTNPGQIVPADPTCLPEGSATPVTTNIRASGYVLTGSRVGYAGRPVEVFNPASGQPPFQLAYENEDLLSCPIMPDAPEDWPPPPAAISACEADPATCRAICERLVLARRARRIFYVTNRCSEQDTACSSYWTVPPNSLVFPFPKGPALTFKLGVKHQGGGFAPPYREAFITFNTVSGLVPAVRVPYSGSAVGASELPGGVVLFDRSLATGVVDDPIRGFVPFTNNAVLDFSPSVPGQNATTIR